MMKIILSPAKSLNYKNQAPVQEFSIPHFIEESKKVDKELRKKSKNELKELMSISDSLAQLNYERNQERTYELEKGISEKVKQAVYTFDGDVYTGLDAYTISDKNIQFMQNHLWLLSGLYGVLKPLDLIEAYRLEMGTKMSVNNSKDLYDFWKGKITNYINEQMSEKDVLVNLASNEYFSVIDKKNIKSKIIVPEFKDYKEGKLKTISFYAKKARGLMARYIIDNQIKNVEEIKLFNQEGYQYDERLSTDEKWTFTR